MIINDNNNQCRNNSRYNIIYLLRFDFLRQFMNQYLFYSIILTVFKHYEMHIKFNTFMF